MRSRLDGDRIQVTWENAFALRPIKVTVMWANFGPYHLARARALLSVPNIDPTFIEIAASESGHPWQADRATLAGRMHTLFNGSLENYSANRMVQKAINLLNEIRPNVVAIPGYSDKVTRAVAAWARRSGRGVVLMSESTAWDWPRIWWREIAKRLWIWKYVDAAFVGGAPHRLYMSSLGLPSDRIVFRCDVVDNEFFASEAGRVRNDDAMRGRLGLPESYFLFVGRLAPEKNIARLLKAYGQYATRACGRWSLVIVGSGPQERNLREMASRDGLDGVVWTGFTQIQELPAYYALANCFILPSTREPWGLVVNEAMACGLPVIVSKVCGCAADLVRNGVNGFTFHPTSVEELYGAMTAMASASAERRKAMGAASAEIISEWTPVAWGRELRAAAEIALTRRAASHPYAAL